MSDSDFQLFLLDTVEMLDLPDGDTVVYPTGALMGRSYRIPGEIAAEFYHWRLTAISPSAARLWLTRALVFACLIVAILAGRILGGDLPGVDFIVIASALAGLTTTAATLSRRRFLAAFPMAEPFRHPARYRRLIQAIICHPAFAFWKCAVIGGAFALQAVVLASILSHTAASLPVQTVNTLVGAILLLLTLTALAAVPGWITVNHLKFRRRNGRWPQLEDAQTLA